MDQHWIRVHGVSLPLFLSPSHILSSLPLSLSPTLLLSLLNMTQADAQPRPARGIICDPASGAQA